ncbi:Bud site selection protein 6 [Thecaphora frezii]
MFSNLVGRKSSGERQHHHTHQRQASSSASSSGSPYDRIRHPQHVEVQPQLGGAHPTSPTSDRSHGLAHPRGPRHDSTGSTSSIAMMHRSPAQLPEEMRAREREKQVEREREREREKERMRERERERESQRLSSTRSSSASQRTSEQPALTRVSRTDPPLPSFLPVHWTRELTPLTLFRQGRTVLAVAPRSPSCPPPPSQKKTYQYSSNHMESSVTRLLVATKMLLESLTKWSLGERSEMQVSDIYVRLGNDFNSARVAFGSYGIDMSDLASVPDDLRACLERCLSEDASPAVLEVHLPRIREIIINLLQGLKMKQAEYKQFLVQRRASQRPDRDGTPPSSSNAKPGRAVGSSRSERAGASEGLPTTQEDAASAEHESLQRASSTGNPATAAALTNPSVAHSPPLASPVATSGRSSLARAPERTSTSVGDARVESAPSNGDRTAHRKGVNDGAGDSPIATADGLRSPGGSDKPVPAIPDDVHKHSLIDPSHTAGEGVEEEPQEEILPAVERAEEKLSGKRSSHRSSSKSARHAMRPSMDLHTDPADADPSMKALKNRDALERRASKRFSAYTFNKMGVGQNFASGSLNMAMFPPINGALGSPLPERQARDQRGSVSRRLQRPPLPDSTSSSDTASPSGTIKSVDYFSAQPPARSKARSIQIPDKSDSIDEVKTPNSAASGHASEGPTSPGGRSTVHKGGDARGLRNNISLLSPMDSRRVMSMAISSTESLPFVDAVGPASDMDHGATAQPPLPTPAERARLDAAQDGANSAAPGVLHVYVQLGRQTRKASLELDLTNASTRGITIARLRMLFIDKFAYSPGMDDFPTIYIKDPVSGVSYELENLDDLQEGCLLTLNIEPLDQVKQHLDLSLGAITRELRELKAAMSERDREARRVSHNFTSAGDSSFLNMANAATPTKITDSQFQAAGHRVAQLKRANTRAAAAAAAAAASSSAATALDEAGPGDAGDASARISFDATSTTSSQPGSSISGSRIAHELKVQYDELQALRREFAVMRQLQGDFDSDVKSIIGGIREQAAKVRQIASAEVPAERNFIIAGKTKLDSSSQEVLTLIEDLQDTVDDLKLDVIQRGVKPKPALVKQITSDIERATKGLLEVEKYVQTVKPSWKKTWETELQNIVDEQEFLNHQESLIADLRDDNDALQEVFRNIQQVVKLRGAGRAGGKYIPPLPEEGHEGLSTVMLEVKSQAVNHEKRLRALQAAEKQRQKDLASRSDEFADELAGFVDGKALRKTGGHIEAERVRQKRDHATFKAMFGGGGAGGAPVSAQGTAVEKPKKFILGGGGGGGSTAKSGSPKANGGVAIAVAPEGEGEGAADSATATQPMADSATPTASRSESTEHDSPSASNGPATTAA